MLLFYYISFLLFNQKIIDILILKIICQFISLLFSYFYTLYFNLIQIKLQQNFESI